MLDDPAIQMVLALFPLYISQLYLHRKIGQFAGAINRLQRNQQSMHDHHLANPDYKEKCPMCGSRTRHHEHHE